MNKRVMAGIIGLMGIALVGLTWSQFRLIKSATFVNKERFRDKVVFALEIIVKRLETLEEKSLLLGSLNADIEIQTLGIPGTPKAVSPGDIPLENRIGAELLDQVLREEFQKVGIDSTLKINRYHYGVFGFEKGKLLILDGIRLSDKQTKADSEFDLLLRADRISFSLPVFRGERPVPGELRIFFPELNRIILQSMSRTLLASGVFAGIILLCFGYTLYVLISQRKLSEMKTDFINNMTHEFKTPIATISLAADSLDNPVIRRNEEKVTRFARIIKQENIRMHKQVEKVLQMALLEKKDFNLKWTAVNMHELIRQAIENISLSLEAREGSVKGFLNAADPVVRGDATHLANIINNLLDNANKYSPRKPHITLFTRNVDQGIEIIIKDEGIGLSRDARKFIFEKFYRVSTGNVHNVKGFGLGLTYVKTMVEAHRGKIEVRSDLGKGSSFILYFPAQQPILQG